MIKFPLPEEHRYGIRPTHALIHDGRTNHQDSMWLRVWQGRMRNKYPETGIEPTGVFDAATVRAVVKIQEGNDLPPTGFLDRETWEVSGIN